MNRNYWKKTAVSVTLVSLAVLGITTSAQGETNQNELVYEVEEVNGPESSIFGDITYFLEVNYPEILLGSKWNVVTQAGTIIVIPGKEQQAAEAIMDFTYKPDIIAGNLLSPSYREADAMVVEILNAVLEFNIGMPLEGSYDPETNTVLLGVYFDGVANEDDLYFAIQNSLLPVFKRVIITIESLGPERIGQVASIGSKP